MDPTIEGQEPPGRKPQGTEPLQGASGLTSQEAARRLREQGPNEIRRAEARSPVRQFLEQFNSPMIWLLLGACILSGFIGELADAVAIGTIVLFNALVGFFQEYRAERAVLALRSMTAPRARVLRDGRSRLVPAAQVVSGDVLVLEAGDVVAADARLLEAHSLATNEAPLTGESTPVEKHAVPVAPEAPLAERHDCVFLGTAVTSGTGRAEVIATGMRTELGRIAHLLESAEESVTPLQVRLAGVSRMLLFLCLGLVAVVFVLGLLHGQPWLVVLLSATSLAVAAVPEGLPAVVTIALAIGVQRMAGRNVLVRKLPAVETLGSASVICTDKTGTLTTGRMTVRELWGQDGPALLFAAAACCDAELGEEGRTGTGDPTEVALLLAAAERGIRREDIERERPRRAVLPFDSDRKRMSILRADGVLYVKGAVDVLLPRCGSGTQGALAANEDMARRGLRVLAVATGHDTHEEELRLLGLVGMADPPRTDAIDAIAAARRAGVRTVMLTGDHPITAQAIAREMGILHAGEAPSLAVHARVTAEDKLKIVREWKARGEVVAMTGDGVNDAPALREAHIGIAMGLTGTEVTREAADMILTDDRYSSIVAAVQEGRGIFENIRKTLVYLLAGNSGELALMLGASVAGLPAPLLPLHLLWINLVTDGLPALALVMDPTDKDVLEHPPRRLEEPMLGRSQWGAVLFTGALMATVGLTTFIWTYHSRGLESARSLTFFMVIFSELFRAFAARSQTRLFWEVGAFTNLRLLGVVGVSTVVQVAIHYFPATQTLFRLEPFSWRECALAMLLGLIPVSAVELSKLAHRFPRRAPSLTD
ncbi:cation-translocating P-type ATPase [Corallococcus caeni]|uniref:cation-translocating P-type ATPase n=1 Tax=Corallococcus caeni TaxID=3082388 RepID=UPI002956263B|nr:cation-translocating P-type ATPase [Corallococcus sp. KH5-1]